MNNRVKSLIENSLIELMSVPKEKQTELIAFVQSRLDQHYGLIKVGGALDQDCVLAGRIFLRVTKRLNS